MTEDDLRTRDDLVGGDIETQKDGDVYRGPIKSIRIEDGQLIVEAEWLAKMTPGVSDWEAFTSPIGNTLPVSIGRLSDIGQGRLFWSMPMLGVGTIFPKGGSKLDPAKVKGLVITA